MAGALKKLEVEDILKEHKKYTNEDTQVFIETGTWRGRTLDNINDCFKTLHTIEIQKRLFQRASAKFKKYDHIKCYLGDSPLILPDLLEKINESIFFFLDGHKVKGPVEGEKDVPLLDELNIINKRNFNNIIVIDDVRLFGQLCKTLSSSSLNWTDITEENILNFFENKLFAHYVNNDRMIIFQKKTD